MKKVSTAAAKQIRNFSEQKLTIGLDLGEYDKLVVVLQLFKRYGKIKLIESTDWPEYVDTIRAIYEAEEIESMFTHADQDEALFLKFLSFAPR